MKKISLLALGLLLFLGSCQKGEDNGYYLNGTIEGLEDGAKVYISELDKKTKSPKVVDTAVIKNNKFEIDLEDKEVPGLSFLRFEGVNGNVVYIAENKTINFKVDKDSLLATTIDGGRENKALMAYLEHINELKKKNSDIQKKMRKSMASNDTANFNSLRKTQMELRDNDINAREKLFQEYNDAYLSVMILSDMLASKTVPLSEVKEKFAKIPENIKKTILAQSLKENLDRMNASEVGSKAPEFSAPNPQGEKVSLKDVMKDGKVIVIDFWAAWCQPCRVENPNLVRTYNKYKDQGLKIVSVSLDRQGQSDRWKKAIKDDKLEQWNHVSNLKFWREPVARKYGVTAIPATFILDETGTIVAKNLRGDKLDEKIGELLN